jgi:AcrR family transcriptional regulator
MFADRGYEAVTLREIAKEVGYTHAVIYQHFPDKWHILAELSRETIVHMVQNFDAIAAKTSCAERASICDFTRLDSILHRPSAAVP